ncbi:MAG TPA: YdcF family protein [Rhizobiaceae bacterium]|nr:YdcF family protein [Rhizobiaceae bacterium]
MAHHAVSGSPAGTGTRNATTTGAAGWIVRAILGLACAFILLTLAGFIHFTTQVGSAGLRATSSADGIVVLTGGKARVETAISLLAEGKAGRLLISGAHRDSSSASIRRAVKGDAKMFACCIDIDKNALDTIGNAEEAAAWAAQHGFDSLIVVTSDYHMPRSLLELGRKLPGTEIQPWPVPSTPVSITDLASLRLLLPEYAKYVAAQLGLGMRESHTSSALAANLQH